MPELPEVETITRGVEQWLSEASISSVDVYQPKLRQVVPSHLTTLLPGKRITSVRRRAKYLCAELDSETVLVVHFGMSGKLVCVAPNEPFERQKHDHVVIHFTDKSQLVYRDPRRFGLLTLVESAEINTHPLFCKLGPEPLGNEFNGHYLHEKLLHRKQSVKQAIMDAAVVVGVGNIYASEALFRSGIDPRRPSYELSEVECERLASNIRTVLTEAIEAGGSTLRDFAATSGESGYFQHRFQVYGREDKPCVQCNTPIQRLVLGQRSSFYCPQCQQ